MALSNFVCPKSGTKIASKGVIKPYLMSSPALKVRSEPYRFLDNRLKYMELKKSGWGLYIFNSFKNTSLRNHRPILVSTGSKYFEHCV
jgi:hypothetical protein